MIKSRRFPLRLSGVALLVCAAALSLAQPARAGLVDLDSSGHQDAVFVRGNNLSLTDLHSSRGGTVTLRLQDLSWTSVLQSVSITLSRFGETVFTHTGQGSWTFDIDKGESLSLGVYALAGGARGYGLYTIDCEFIPHSPEVPVPAAGLLFASGLTMLTALRRRGAGRERRPA